MNILQVTAHFAPNVGGVETHLSDLVTALLKRGHRVNVLTYRPLMSHAKWQYREKKKNYTVIRLPYLPGMFYTLVTSPMLEFLYLMPGLFISLPFWLLSDRPDVIHTHGLVAGFVGVFWGKIFGIRTITTTHNIYNFPVSGLYKRFVQYIFSTSDHVLTLSRQSKNEVASLGIDKAKITNFTYWIDLDKFKKQDIASLTSKFKGFNVLFVGRLVEIKGVKQLLKAASNWNVNVKLLIAGEGPLEDTVKKYAHKYKNITYLGKLSQEKLPDYYTLADVLIVPSINEEGFGRVIIEALACGTPVIGSNKGGIPEAIDSSVGELINISPETIKKTVEKYYKNRAKLDKLKKSARPFALKRYSEKNVNEIIKTYTK